MILCDKCKTDEDVRELRLQHESDANEGYFSVDWKYHFCKKCYRKLTDMIREWKAKS